MRHRLARGSAARYAGAEGASFACQRVELAEELTSMFVRVLSIGAAMHDRWCR